MVDFNKSVSVGTRYGAKGLNLDWYISRIPTLAANIKKAVAKELFEEIVNTVDVPFRTGRYVASHRIGVGSEDTSYATEDMPNLGTARMKVLASELPKLENIGPNDNVYLSNSVRSAKGFPYADKVEWKGWIDSDLSSVESDNRTRRVPYLVYEKAVLKVKPRIRGIINDLRAEKLFVDL